MREVHHRLGIDFPIEYLHTPAPRDNDAVLSRLSPGSSLTGEANFPEGALVWDFNYQGDLLFLRHTREQGPAHGPLLEGQQRKEG